MVKSYDVWQAVIAKEPYISTDILDGWQRDYTYSADELAEYIKDHHPEVWQKILPEVTELRLKGDNYETERYEFDWQRDYTYAVLLDGVTEHKLKGDSYETE